MKAEANKSPRVRLRLRAADLALGHQLAGFLTPRLRPPLGPDEKAGREQAEALKQSGL